VSPGVRRCLHVSTALLPLLVPLERYGTLRAALLWGVPLVLGLELLRLGFPPVAAWLAATIPVFRPSEANRLSGAAWLWLGFAVAVLFAPLAARGGMVVSALADPAASWIGGRWGKGAAKSWVGSAVVLIVGGLTLAGLGFDLRAVAAAGAGAAAIERWSRPLDDNLVLAPGVAAILWILA